MDTQPEMSFKESVVYAVGEMAKAVSSRVGEGRQQQIMRTRIAANTVMDFRPRDSIEVMLAGRCMMFHEVLTDAVRDAVLSEMDAVRRANRASLASMDKVFGANLTRLDRYRTRLSQGYRDDPDAAVRADAPREVEARRVEPEREAPTEVAPVTDARTAMPTPAVAMANRPDAGTASPVASPIATANKPAAPAGPMSPTEGSASSARFQRQIAACMANPKAMAAIDAGDAEGFAHAMGVDAPCEEYLQAAAAPGSPFDRRGFRPKTSDASRDVELAEAVSGRSGKLPSNR